MRRIIARESDDQKALAQLLDTIRLNGRPLLWCHVPNEGKRDKLYAVELQRRGVKPGVLDNLIFDSPPKYPKIKGVAIELKRKTGDKPTKDQLQWIYDLEERGWSVHICYGIDAAIEALRIEGYLHER